MPAVADKPATSERIVDAALQLFSERGFQGTTVGEIERAAGLTPRAGGIYKHFPSKEAVLEAAFDRYVAEIEDLHSAIEMMPLGDLRAELTLLLRWGLKSLARERALRRIVITEGDRFPELKRRYREGVADRSYAEATEFIRMKMESGELPEGDAEATAVVFSTALLGFNVELDVFGRRPAGVDEERLIGAIVDAFLGMAQAGGAPSGARS